VCCSYSETLVPRQARTEVKDPSYLTNVRILSLRLVLPRASSNFLVRHVYDLSLFT